MGANHNPVDLAYAAGFFDGEGAVSILRVRARRSGKGRDIYKVLVIVVNTNRPVLERFQGQFGGKLYKSNFKTKPTYWRPLFQWHLWGEDCERFLRDLRPNLFIKGALADSALEFFALQHLRVGKRDTAPEVWERMKQLHAAHRALQQKGSRTRATDDAVTKVVAVPATRESGQLELDLPSPQGIRT
jgi:hypothetical protein